MELLIEVFEDLGQHDSTFRRKATLELVAPMLFFSCTDYLQQAKYIVEHNELEPETSSAEKEFLNAVADGAVSEAQQQQFADVKLTDHPPAWLRRERVGAIIAKYIREQRLSETQVASFDVGLSLVNNADSPWLTMRPNVQEMVRGRKPVVNRAVGPDRQFLYQPK